MSIPLTPPNGGARSRGNFRQYARLALVFSMMTLVVVFFGMYLGSKVKKFIDAKFYVKILKVVLFFTALTLIIQTINS